MNTVPAGQALFILGMHRSGTSALARAVNLLGVELGSNLMDAAEDNERGFWEQEDIVQLHERLLAAVGSIWHGTMPLPDNWQADTRLQPFRTELKALIEQNYLQSGVQIWALKDPRMSVLLPFWMPLLAEYGIAPHCIITLRHPQEVADSLTKRDGFETRHGFAAWLHYTLMAEYHSRGLPRCVVDYDGLLDDWESVLTQAASRLDLAWPVSPEKARADINAFLSSGLRHNRASADCALPPPTATVYRLMQDAAAQGTLDTQALDTIRAEWQQHSLPHRLCLTQTVRHYMGLEDALRTEVQALTEQRDTLLARYEDAEGRARQVPALQHRVAELETTLRALHASTSWKLTKPLRAAKELVKSEPKE